MKDLWKIRLVGAILMAMAWPVCAQSQVAIGNKKITSIGCHNSGTPTCYFSVDSAFDAKYCTATTGGNSYEIRMDNSDSIMGRRTYATLLAAYLAGRSVNIVLSGGCTADGYPAIAYIRVLN